MKNLIIKKMKTYKRSSKKSTAYRLNRKDQLRYTVAAALIGIRSWRFARNILFADIPDICRMDGFLSLRDDMDGDECQCCFDRKYLTLDPIAGRMLCRHCLPLSWEEIEERTRDSVEEKMHDLEGW